MPKFLTGFAAIGKVSRGTAQHNTNLLTRTAKVREMASVTRNESELELRTLLQGADLLSYYDKFIEIGGDNVQQLRDDFQEVIRLVDMARKPLHVKRLKKALTQWTPQPVAGTSTAADGTEGELHALLRRADLISYHDKFMQIGGDNVQQLYDSTVDDFQEVIDLVDMARKPLHVKRLKKTLTQWTQQSVAVTSTPSDKSQGELYELLRRADLLSYYDNFIELAADNVQRLCDSTDEEFQALTDQVDMTRKPLHVKRLKTALIQRSGHAAITTSIPRNESERQLYELLQQADLLVYYDTFIEKGGDNVQQLLDSTEEEFQEFIDIVGMARNSLHVTELKKALEQWRGRPGTCHSGTSSHKSVVVFSTVQDEQPIAVEESPETENIRSEMHLAIERRDVERVRESLQAEPRLKIWMNPHTKESAVHRALSQAAFNLYVFLRSQKCIFKDPAEQDCLNRLNPLEKAELARQQNFAMAYKGSHLSFLKSRSKSRADFDGFDKILDNLYGALASSDLVKPVLKVASMAPYLSIHFDFEQEDIQSMAGGSRTDYGLTDPEKEDIFVGAKGLRAEPSHASEHRTKEVAGTLIHELCHLAVFLVYGNQGKPYRSTDAVSRERYADIVNDVRGRKGDLHQILQLAFQENDEQELIVRIPHILALCPTEANAILEQQVPRLYQFYKTQVLEDMKQCIRNGCPIKDIEIMKEENGKLGKASSTEELGIEFEAGLDESTLQRGPLVVLIASNITFLEAMVNDLLRSATVPYLFLEASRWCQRTKFVLVKNKCSFLLVSCDGKSDLKEIVELWKELHRVTGTKIVLLTSEGNLAHCLQEVERTSSHVSGIYFDVIHSATFGNVTSECKSAIIQKSRIALQSSSEETLIQDILDVGSFLEICQEDTFLALCRAKALFLGPQLQELPKNISECYIEQKCGRSVVVDLHKITGCPQNDAFAVFGCSKETLHSLLPAGLTVKRMSDLDKFQQIVILESDSEYEPLIEHEHYKGKTVHLLEFHERRFMWKKSNGAVSHLPMTGQEIYSANYLLKTSEKVIVVSGDPGMGKTVLATNICRDIKKADGKAWVLYVSNYPNTQEATKMLIEETGGTNFKLFAKLCGVKTSGEEFQLFQQSVTEGSPFNVWVIFDALDEIQETSRKTILDLAKRLTQGKVFKILIFTRTLLRKPTEEEIHSVAFCMIPFSEGDQAQFQKKYKEYAYRMPPHEPNTKIDDKTSQSILHHVRVKANYLLGNPLFLTMVTELEQGKACDSDYWELMQRMCNCGDCYTRLLVYRLFVEYKYLRYRKEKKCEVLTKAANKDDHERLKEIFYHDHELLALKAVLSKDDLTRLLSESERSLLENGGRLTMEVKENKHKHGLIQELRNGAPRFLHHSFAEFLAAYSIFKRVKKAHDKGDEDVIIIVSNMYGDSAYDGMLTFLDGFAAEGHAVHCSIMNNDIENLKASAANGSALDDIHRTPLHVAALHAHQDVLKLLDSNEVLTQRDMLGMTPLRYADQIRSWETLDVFCARRGSSAINWFDEIPTAARNITTETKLSRSILMIVIGKRLKGLLSVLLKMFCKNKMCPTETCPKREIQHSTKNVRSSAATVHILMDIDRIRVQDQRTPLHFAVGLGKLDIVQVLLPYSSLDIRDVTDRTVFQACALVGHTNVLRHLLPLASPHDWYISDNTGPEQKLAALDVGNRDAAELLIPHFLTRTAIKEDLLYVSVVSGNDGVTKAILPHTDASGRYMPYGRTTFQACVGCADIDVVRLMLPYANLDGSDERGTTTLRITADDIVSWDRHRTCDVDIAKLLILHCDIDSLDMDGKTALRMCITCTNNFPVFKQVLLYMLVTCPSISQVMSVHYVAKAVEEDILKYLISVTRINAQDENGYTPLAHCCSHGYLRAAKLLLPLTVVDFGSFTMISSLIPRVLAGEYGIVELLLPHSLESSCHVTLAAAIKTGDSAMTKFCQPRVQARLGSFSQLSWKSVFSGKQIAAKLVAAFTELLSGLVDAKYSETIEALKGEPTEAGKQWVISQVYWMCYWWACRKRAAETIQAIAAVTKMYLPHVDINGRTTMKRTMWLESVCQGCWALVQLLLPYTERRDSDVTQNTPLLLSVSKMSSATTEPSQAEDQRNLKMNIEQIRILKLLILHSDFGVLHADRTVPHGGSAINLHIMKFLSSCSSANKLVFPHYSPASRIIGVAEFIECIESIEEQDILILKYLIPYTRINTLGESTALAYCCGYGYLRAAKLLVPLAVVDFGLSLMIVSFIRGLVAGEYGSVELLLPHSLKRSVCDTLANCIASWYKLPPKFCESPGQASLHRAVTAKSVKGIEDLWDPLMNSPDVWDGRENGAIATVTKLYLPHVDVNDCTTMKRTMWLESVCLGCWALVQLLLPYTETRECDVTQNTPLLLSATKMSSATTESSHAEDKQNVEMHIEEMRILKLLILHSDFDVWGADRVLPHGGGVINLHLMKFLCSHSSVNKLIFPFPHSPPASRSISVAEFIECLATIEEQDILILKYLIPYTRINAHDAKGRTPLAYCGYYTCLRAAKLLLPLTLVDFVSSMMIPSFIRGLVAGEYGSVELLLPHSLKRSVCDTLADCIASWYKLPPKFCESPGQASLHRALTVKSVKGIEDLLDPVMNSPAVRDGRENGAIATVTKLYLPHVDVNDCTTMKRTMWLESVCLGCWALVQLLLPYTETRECDVTQNTQLLLSVWKMSSATTEPSQAEDQRNLKMNIEQIRILKLLILHSDFGALHADRAVPHGGSAINLHIVKFYSSCSSVNKLVFPHSSPASRIISVAEFIECLASIEEQDIPIVMYVIPYTRINGLDENRDTPLAHCCSHGYVSVAKLLLPLTVVDFGLSVIFAAFSGGFGEREYGIVELLLPHSLKRSICHSLALCVESWYQILTVLCGSSSEASLCRALMAYSLEAIKDLLQRGIEGLLQVCRENDAIATVTMSLPHVDVNVRTTMKRTMWHESVCQGCWVLVQLFLPYTETRDSDISQNTPLLLSATKMSSANTESSQAEDQRNVKMSIEKIRILKLLILHSNSGTLRAHRALPHVGSATNIQAMKILHPHLSMSRFASYTKRLPCIAQ
ncbi:uncharacterized protein LOC135379088 [Ornithodoros turicata]|uniref:uncharacterized protein LOC135379088 n=1 Tax=Ornithodoros turicata TaxID=34597 RepID=UPI003138A930